MAALIPDRVQPKDIALDKEYRTHQKVFTFGKGMKGTPSVAAQCATDTDFLSSIAKVIKNIFVYPAVLVAAIPFDNVVKHCGGFADTFKFLGIFKGIKTVHDRSKETGRTGIKLHERNLGIASGSLQIVIGAATFTKLLETFGALKIADITQALGRSSVLGKALAIALPFTVVTNFLEIGKNIVDIASASLRIHQNRKQKSLIQGKKRDFNEKSNQVGKFMERHIVSMNGKQSKGVDALKQLAEGTPAAKGVKEVKGIQATIDAITEKEQKCIEKQQALQTMREKVVNSPCVIRNLKTVGLRWNLRKAKLSLFRSKAKHDKLCEKYNNLRDKCQLRSQKIEAWTKLNAHFNTTEKVSEKEDDPLRQLIMAKQRKWTAQCSSFNLKNFQEACGIGINILASITLVAATVLFFSGVATVPATLGLTSLFLIISLMGTGNGLLKKFTKHPRIVPVNVTDPQFCPAPAA